MRREEQDVVAASASYSRLSTVVAPGCNSKSRNRNRKERLSSSCTVPLLLGIVKNTEAESIF